MQQSKTANKENVSKNKSLEGLALKQGKVEEFALQACPMLTHAPIDKNAVHSAALSIFGRKTNKTVDWFESRSEEMTPVINEKRRALAA